MIPDSTKVPPARCARTVTVILCQITGSPEMDTFRVSQILHSQRPGAVEVDPDQGVPGTLKRWFFCSSEPVLST